jgi:enhancing lycopene biosynthesis protein 2
VIEFVIDRDHKIVSTPAYMDGPAAVFEGFRKTVDEVLGMVGTQRALR